MIFLVIKLFCVVLLNNCSRELIHNLSAAKLLEYWIQSVSLYVRHIYVIRQNARDLTSQRQLWHHSACSPRRKKKVKWASWRRLKLLKSLKNLKRYLTGGCSLILIIHLKWLDKTVSDHTGKSRLLKPPDISNQKLFSMDLLYLVKHCNFPPDFSNQVLFSFEVWQIGIPLYLYFDV